MDFMRNIRARLNDFVWNANVADLPFWHGAIVGTLRVCFAVLRDLIEGQLNLRAMSLVYTTLLSLVPLLAISFSVLKGFGVHNKIEPTMLSILEPLGESGVEITRRVIEFVDNVQVGVLGAVGLLLLLYTVISLMQKIESAFNFIWQVTEPRSLAKTVTDYISVLFLGPLLAFLSIALTAATMLPDALQYLGSIQPLGYAIEQVSRLLPYLLSVAAFTCFYLFMPNTKVHLSSAVIGAAVAAAAWKATGWAFAGFVAGASNYTAIYSSFATLIFFMLWIYIGWMILMLGAAIAFYHQNPAFVTAERGLFRMSSRFKEKLALLMLTRIAEAFQSARPPKAASDLARHYRVPMEATNWIIAVLERHGFVICAGVSPPGYVPGRPLESIRIADVIAAVRSADEKTHLSMDGLPSDPAVDPVIDGLDRAARDSIGDTTVKDLVLHGMNATGSAAAAEPASEARRRA